MLEMLNKMGQSKIQILLDLKIEKIFNTEVKKENLIKINNLLLDIANKNNFIKMEVP